MKDVLLFNDCLNDSFLLYSFENDKEHQPSHSRTNSSIDPDAIIFHSSLSLLESQQQFRLLAECAKMDSCDDVIECIEPGTCDFSGQFQSSIEEISAAAAAALQLEIRGHGFASSHQLRQLDSLQERALKLRIDHLDIHCESAQLFPAFLPPFKSHHRRSLTPHSSLDFYAGCALAMAARKSISGGSCSFDSLSDFNVLRVLDHSTMFGSVFLAQQKDGTCAVPVAIKCSEKSRVRGASEELIAESPTNEIDILRWVSMLPPASSQWSEAHFYPGQQYICRLLQTGEDSQFIYCVLEHFAGGDLQEYVAARQRISETEARRFLWQIVQALYYLHRIAKVAHLDLSLENFLLDEPLNAFVCDFGAAVRISYSNATSSSSSPSVSSSAAPGSLSWSGECEDRHPGFPSSIRPGKLSYMSGELFSGRSFLASAADIYSLGVVLLRMLCGPKVFGLSQPNSALWKMGVQEGRIDAAMEVLEAGEEWEKLSDAVKELIARMLCPESRRANVEDVIFCEWFDEERKAAWKKENTVLKHLQKMNPKKYAQPY